MSLRVSLPPGKYRATLLAPADLKVVEETDLMAADGQPAEIRLPAWTDDLLVRVERRTDGR